MSHPDKRTKQRGFFPLYSRGKKVLTGASYPFLNHFFFILLRFPSCREIILSLLTPMQPQTCQLTGWKRKKIFTPSISEICCIAITAMIYRGLLHIFTLHFSVTQMIFSQQTKNTGELLKFEGKKAKGKWEKGSVWPFIVFPTNISYKNGRNKYN